MEGEEQEDEKGNSLWTYRYSLELPNGDWKFQYYFRLKSNENGEKQEIPEDQVKDFLKVRLEPEPISQEQQRQLDMAEEEENKRREHEARMAQKKLEEEKARLKYEQQQLIAK